MVIFNVWAMVVVPVIFFVLLYVHSYLPSFVAEPHGNVVTSIIALLISGICEIFGLRSRLFFMPIWLISIFAFCYSAFRLWGYMSIGLFVVMLVIFVIVTNKLTRKSEIKQWATSTEKFAIFCQNAATMKPLDFWKEAKKQLFFPIVLPQDDAVMTHNLHVINFLTAQVESTASHEELGILKDYQCYLETHPALTQKINYGNQFDKKLLSLLDDKITKLS